MSLAAAKGGNHPLLMPKLFVTKNKKIQGATETPGLCRSAHDNVAIKHGFLYNYVEVNSVNLSKELSVQFSRNDEQGNPVLS